MTPIKDFLQHIVDGWAQVGHPAILERFVLRNGTVFEPAPYEGKRMKPQNCFQNAYKYISRGGAGEYAEGYVWRSNLPILIHHGWVVHRGKVIDPTLDRPEECQYMGIVFPPREYARELVRGRYYALIDQPTGPNLRMMVERDPGLIDEVAAIAPQIHRMVETIKEYGT